jgi:hypothetical protein
MSASSTKPREINDAAISPMEWFHSYVVDALSSAVGVRGRVVENKGIVRLFEIAVGDAFTIAVQALRERVNVVDIQTAPGFDHVSDDAAPRVDVGKPTQRTEADVGNVEASARERAGGVQDVGADKGR